MFLSEARRFACLLDESHPPALHMPSRVVHYRALRATRLHGTPERQSCSRLPEYLEPAYEPGFFKSFRCLREIAGRAVHASEGCALNFSPNRFATFDLHREGGSQYNWDLCEPAGECMCCLDPHRAGCTYHWNQKSYDHPEVVAQWRHSGRAMPQLPYSYNLTKALRLFVGDRPADDFSRLETVGNDPPCELRLSAAARAECFLMRINA